jgi:hypothetical protein
MHCRARVLALTRVHARGAERMGKSVFAAIVAGALERVDYREFALQQLVRTVGERCVELGRDVLPVYRAGALFRKLGARTCTRARARVAHLRARSRKRAHARTRTQARSASCGPCVLVPQR